MPTKPLDPIFVLDSAETFWPIDVKSVEEVPATLVTSNGDDGGAVNLASLPSDGGRMNFPPKPEEAEKRLRPNLGKVGYRREVEGGGLTWVQYWLWYLYNPKLVIVTGDHEGDWEFVQVAYAGETPVCMTCSQHHAGGARMWWNVEQSADGRPIVYVARGSHANYFRPVHQIPWVGDVGDAKGERLDDVEWKDFGDWATWAGRWGNSMGEGRSPQSPGCQLERWNDPHVFHSKARIEL